MSGQTRLTGEEIAARLAGLPGWTLLEDKWISCKYRFSSFPEAIAFVGRVAEEAERLNHHPFIAIEYRLVTLKLTSWHAGGLTELDFAAAGRFDALEASP